jgi:hypothetical protein
MPIKFISYLMRIMNKVLSITLLFFFILSGNSFAICPENDGVINNNNGSITIVSDETCSVTNFTVSGGTLTVNGTLTITGSITLSGNGDIIINGSLTIGSSGSLTGNGNLTINGSLTVQDGASLTQSGGGTTDGTGIILVEGTGTVDQDIVDELTVTAGGDGDCTDGCCGSTADCETAQPVTLSSFKGRTFEKAIHINWSTESEENFDYFNIERSIDGKTFNTLGTKKGAGNSKNKIDYSFIDYGPIYGLAYYRLTAIDIDGTFEIFKAITVSFVPDDLLVSIYPNPIQDNKFNLNINLGTIANIKRVTIIDINGALIKQIDLLNNTTFVDADFVNKGIYFAKIQIDNYFVTKRIIVN